MGGIVGEDNINSTRSRSEFDGDVARSEQMCVDSSEAQWWLPPDSPDSTHAEPARACPYPLPLFTLEPVSTGKRSVTTSRRKLGLGVCAAEPGPSKQCSASKLNVALVYTARASTQLYQVWEP